MALVNAEQLQSAFAEWMKAGYDVTDGVVMAIDDKLRGRTAAARANARSHGKCLQRGKWGSAGPGQCSGKVQRDHSNSRVAQLTESARVPGDD